MIPESCSEFRFKKPANIILNRLSGLADKVGTFSGTKELQKLPVGKHKDCVIVEAGYAILTRIPD